MEFSRQEYWCGLNSPPGDLPDPGIKARSPALQGDSTIWAAGVFFSKAVFPVLSYMSLWLIYFIHSHLYLLIPYLYFTPSSCPFPTGSLISVTLFLFGYIYHLFYFLDSMCKCICLFLTYFTKHDTLKVHSCCCKWQDFILFYGWVVLCIYRYTTYSLSIHLLMDTQVDCLLKT